jgi:hypothetical protein
MSLAGLFGVWAVSPFEELRGGLVPGGERAADLARELVCSDGSGNLRVIQRLERQASEDDCLTGRLQATRR